MDLAAGSRAHSCWRSKGSYGVRDSGQKPVFFTTSSTLQAEGRPTLFLPAKLLDGRQCCFVAVSMAYSCRDLGGPSGFFPGAGEISVAPMQFGPNCVPFLVFGVVFAYSRDFVVMSIKLWVLLLVLLYLPAISNKV